ncbi:DHH family phosphoesterase [Candidatus Pacearchaeota archaeon]|nr:DHH family phosphoesterase [Candidatus Pacearchaeota archaeon]
MILLEELQKIRDHLEASQNPLFFFDNDADGLCAFLILQRAIGRGRGVAIKSFPDLKEQYLKKVEEFNPDAIFIIDKPEVSKEFVEGVEERGIPIIWIDHHETKTPKELIERTYYFNSLPSAEPTTYIAQKIFNRQEDMWLAVMGCIGDAYLPDFAEKFSEQNPELFNYKFSAFDTLHSSEIGKMVRMLNFGLMDSITNVVNLIKYLSKAKNAYDLLEENKYTQQLHKRYSQLNEFYNKQVNKAEANFDSESPVLFFSYSGNTSMSSEIANKLYYNHKDKLIVVAFKRPEKINISIRGENALQITHKAIQDIEGATGGGHENATGAMVPVDDFEKFKENIKQIIS